MKNTLYIIIILVTLQFFGCKKSSNYKQLVKIDSLLSKEFNDSALMELDFINKNTMISDEDIAYYNLLQTQILWRLYKPVEADSILDFSIRHYEKTKDNEKLIRSYYYKGIIHFDKKKSRESVLCLKKAEQLAKTTSNGIIKHHIYESLVYCNMYFKDYPTAIFYNQKAYDLAQKSRNYNWKVYACERFSNIYIKLNMKDSALYYLEKSLPILKHIKKDERAYTLTNMGIAIKDIDKDKAAEYFKKALGIDTLSFTLKNLAYLYMEEGKKDEAFSLLNKAASHSGQQLKLDILKDLHMLSYKENMYKEAADISIKIKKMEDSLNVINKENEIKELQMKYDIEAKDKEIESQRNIFILYIAVLILISILLYLIYIYKTTKNKQQIAEDKMLISAYEKEIEQLRTSGKNVEKEVERLNKKISDSRQRNAGILQKGYQLYNDIVEGGTVVRWSKSDFEYFMEYYGTMDIVFVNRLETEYYKLSPKYMFFCTLYHMGKGDEEVERIMGISSNTIRSTKSRINSKRQTDSTEMPDMLFVKE